MQKHNKNKNIHVRAHHIRIGAVAIAVATGFHISGAAHLGSKLTHEVGVVNTVRGYHHEMERENETARHMVRFDAGLRLPSTSGSSL
jgi:hypothetical protein